MSLSGQWRWRTFYQPHHRPSCWLLSSFNPVSLKSGVQVCRDGLITVYLSVCLSLALRSVWCSVWSLCCVSCSRFWRLMKWIGVMFSHVCQIYWYIILKRWAVSQVHTNALQCFTSSFCIVHSEFLVFTSMCSDLLSRSLKSAFDTYDVERMITSFLLARQASLEGPAVFPSYSDWFKVCHLFWHIQHSYNILLI